MAGSTNDSGGGDDIAAAAARELNDLRLVFANIAGYKKFLGLRSILKLKEVKAQIAGGDVYVEDLESAWLEACAVKGVSSVDPEDGKGGTHHVHQRSSWGVCTELSFEGFVHFLRLCEEKASISTDLATATEASPKDPATGRDLVAARHRMVGLLRATLTVHQRGGGGEEEENEHPADRNAPLGETLHTSMVRAAVEEGLAHHNTDTLHELMRTGVYKESEEGVQLDRDEKKASLRHGLLHRKFSHHDLVRSGIILKEQTPGQLAGERALAASRVSRHLQQRSAGSAADLLLAAGRKGVPTAAASQHRRHPSLDELKARGIYRTPEQLVEDDKQHRLARAYLEQELGHRANISDLKERGIYLSQEDRAKQSLQRAMLGDMISKSFRERPYREDLMDRGVLEASQLKSALETLENEQGRPIKTVDDVLKWPLVANAVKEGVVRMPVLKDAFAMAMKIPDGEGGGGGGGRQHMRYEEFDKFLSSAETTQVEDEPFSLKLWALMRMRPELEDQEHHEGNRRRNALIARELEEELGKREPLERLANKGIYLEKTPTEGAVERAHLTHTLAHGLAHRPALAELSHKGVYLDGVAPDELEKAHRDARNYLEGSLSLRPTIDTLQDKGYLEADELEEAFTELVLEYKHDATDTDSAENDCGSGSRLLLPVSRLTEWAPVRKMLRSGTAMEEDVAAATAKAQKASFHRRGQHLQAAGGGEQDGKDAVMIDFVGFLEFIHTLDIAVDGLGADASAGKTDDHDDNDPEAAAKHARRLEMRRKRATHAAEEDSYGTLKEHLLAHLRARPKKDDPETQRIAKEFHSTEAVDLEKSLLKNRLEGHLRSRAAESAAATSGSSKGGERTARIKELELAMNQRMLEHSLAASGGDERSGGAGVGSAAAGAEEGLDMEGTREALGGSLGRRSSLEELTNQGIFQRTTPLQHGLERQLIEERLSRSLRNPLRPSKEDLVEHGIYIDATPRELQMEHYLAARNLKHGLERRESIQDLKDHGVYQPENSMRAAHEKLLIKALLQRKLSHAFSREEIDRLKQKGVYKEAEHEKLEAERLLVTRQLARLVSKRPDPAQMEQEHPELMKAGTLALVFEERVMPRAAAGSVAGAATVAEAGEKEGEVVAESEGGPEHLVSFDGLLTWPDVQDHLVGEGGEDIKHEMARHFDLCDSDGDGYITFSQFLRWVELCDLDPDDHLQVTDSNLDAEYARLEGASGKGGITLDQALSYPLVKRWVASASLDRDALSAMWGMAASEGGSAEGNTKQLDGFKSFCRHCEARSSAAHQMRHKELLADAAKKEAKAKEDLRATMAAKLSARPDLDKLKESRIYRSGGLDPAMVHLERNLIAISLKEQLLARPAIEDLEKRNIKPKDGTKVRLDHNSSKLREALDSTMRHDDAIWRSHPSELVAGSRQEVSALLEKSLSKRLEKTLLTNKGIYIDDTDASYALLVHQVLRAHRGFTLSSAQLVASL